MAKLIDLDEEVDPDDVSPPHNDETENSGNDNAYSGPNVGVFSAALVCYPITSQLASYLDLNSLHALSRTCRQFRASLLQYRTLLITYTLHCANETGEPAVRLGDALYASQQVSTAHGRDGIKIGRITSGKIGVCARDSVGACRRCSRVVCRNCIMKSPPSSHFKMRFRRICRTCMKSPLDSMVCISNRDILEPSMKSASHHDGYHTKVFARSPCKCEEYLWICQPCEQSLAVHDRNYQNSFSWRSRYSCIGGMGAGLGTGNEGLECGRNKDLRCLAAHDVVQESECDLHADKTDPSSCPSIQGDSCTRHWKGSSYTTAEIVGIGGSLKKKVRNIVPVGAEVKEYEDERGGKGRFMLREQNGVNRCWCSWCARVVLGRKDRERMAGSSESLGSSDSSSSSA